MCHKWFYTSPESLSKLFKNIAYYKILKKIRKNSITNTVKTCRDIYETRQSKSKNMEWMIKKSSSSGQWYDGVGGWGGEGYTTLFVTSIHQSDTKQMMGGNVL